MCQTKIFYPPTELANRVGRRPRRRVHDKVLSFDRDVAAVHYYFDTALPSHLGRRLRDDASSPIEGAVRQSRQFNGGADR